MRTLLILGGTRDAYDLAQILASQPGLRVVSSLAGRTDAPRRPAGEMRVGGFGGPQGLASYLRDNGIDAVVDATHPFAMQMGWNAARACAETGTRLLRLERPAWQAGPGDRWHFVDDWQQAAPWLAANSRRALLAVGRQDVAAFAGLDHIWFLIRSVQPPDPPPSLAQAEFLLARGPFDQQAEHDLLRTHRIDTIVCKNSGGVTDGKLLAARQLGLPVVMRQRPPRPATAQATDIPQVLDWLGL
ncbi:MAG: cobalt-precorrin-6A reductase [Magnetospirillum sp.]|nr:cobalt-precorrin-6A reductase [Magnetospirillum sp.]